MFNKFCQELDENPRLLLTVPQPLSLHDEFFTVGTQYTLLTLAPKLFK